MSDTKSFFDIDVDTLYDNLVKELDSRRGLINVTSPQSDRIFDDLKGSSKSLDSISEKAIKATEAQESRVSAFHRMIGFPAVATNDPQSTSDFYSPGFNPKADKQKKKNIAINMQSDLIAFFRDRETWYNNILASIFSSPNSIQAGITCLQSGYECRPFSSGINISYKSLQTSEREYQTPFLDPRGNLYSDYTDQNGKTAKEQGIPILGRNRVYIKPLFCSPRADVLMVPANKNICAPFLSTQDSKIGSEQLKRPLLEKIIKERFAQAVQVTINLTEEQKTTAEQVATLRNEYESVDDQSTDINEVFISMENLLSRDAYISNQLLKSLTSIIESLIIEQDTIGAAQTGYRFVPIPNDKGPEFGVGFNGIFISDPKKLNTDIERGIIKIQFAQNARDIATKTASDSSESTVEITEDSYIFGGQVTAVINPAKDAGIQDRDEAKASDLLVSRNEILNNASASLQKVERIIGAFSGVGIIDIIATIAALYLVNRESLLGLLDDDAFNRAVSQGAVPGGDRVNIAQALQDVDDALKVIYNLMNIIYRVMREKGIRFE